MSEVFCRIEQGELQGCKEADLDGTPFLAFMGIPFAKAPLGKLRFKPPQPPNKWEGIRDATKEGSNCMQAERTEEGTKMTGSEDCLFLNVFTRRSRDLKPVMVYIHGGGFIIGSSSRSSYGPEFLMTEDIVLVTINYRVGALGFLVIDDPTLGVTGNAGLKDQIQALKWVQKNISCFGGDPSNVTVFGHSAGAASVNYLLLSPLGKGLFHKAILQSGASLCPWARGVNDAASFARTLGCNERDNNAILQFLQEVSAEELVGATPPLGINPACKPPFGPTLERHSEGPVFHEEPLKTTTSGEHIHVPLMMGYASMECMFEGLNLEDFIPYYFGLAKTSDKFKDTSKRIAQFYFGKDEPDFDDKISLTKVMSDSIFVKDIYKTVKLLRRNSQEPIYFYRMSIDLGMNIYKRNLKTKVEGTCHGDELGYLFKVKGTDPKPGSIEELTVRRLVKMWANFARTGRPIPEKDVILNAEWNPVGDKIHFLDIGADLQAGVDPDLDRMQFWEDISVGVTEKY